VDVLSIIDFFAHPLLLVCERPRTERRYGHLRQNVTQEFGRSRWRTLSVWAKRPLSSRKPCGDREEEFGAQVAEAEGDPHPLVAGVEHVLRNAIQSMPKAVGGPSARAMREGRIFLTGICRRERGAPGMAGHGRWDCLEDLKRGRGPFVTTRNVGVGVG